MTTTTAPAATAAPARQETPLTVTLEYKALSANLGIVARLAANGSAVQALRGVLISAEPGAPYVTLAATDMETSLTIPVAAEVTQPGQTLLPGALLEQIVKALPSGPVTLTSDGDGQVTISAKKARFDLRTLRIGDYPPLPSPGGQATASLPASTLLGLLKATSPAASLDQTRPILTGIQVNVTDTAIETVATDSYRLAVAAEGVANDDGDIKPFSALMPARALGLLEKISDPDASIAVELDGQRVVFRAGAATLTSRLISGQFPDWHQLVPQEFEFQVRLPAATLRDTVQRIGLLAQKNAPLVLAFDNGTLQVSAATPDVGFAVETLEVAWQGEPLRLGLNHAYLSTALASLGGSEVIAHFVGPLRPALLTNPDRPGDRHLLMPIRLSD